MRYAAVLMFGLVVIAWETPAAQAEYYCSPGFEASYGGQCIAVASRDEIELFLEGPSAHAEQPLIRHRRHHHHAVTARY